MRPTVKSMITEDLGYCCTWFFFTRFRQTGLIAARLGVTPQAVRQNKASCGGCAKAEGCLDKQVTLKLTLRKPRGEG